MSLHLNTARREASKQSLIVCLPEDVDNIFDIATAPPVVLTTPASMFSSSSQFSTLILSLANVYKQA